MATTSTGLDGRLEGVARTLTSDDAERLGDLYTREARLMPPDSEILTGRDAAVEFWMAIGEQGVDRIDIESVDVERDGETANRVGRAALFDGSGSQIDRAKFVEVWRREEGEWRIHRDIWNGLGDEA